MTASLDPTVERAVGDLLDGGLTPPDALLLAGIGGGLLPERLADARSVELPQREDFGPWSGARLVQGRVGGLDLWIVDDEGLDTPQDGRHPWRHALPVWVAAATGAGLLLHTSAGASTRVEGEPAPGQLFLATDHLNLSGTSPLRGLGESRYGPLFPDQTRVHDPAVRAALLRASGRCGVPLATGVVACSLGPSIETPAEQAWYETAGARVSVQGLAAPLVAAAHAGLAAAALVAVVQRRRETSDLRRILERSEALAPAVEDLLITAAPELAELAAESDEAALPRVHEDG